MDGDLIDFDPNLPVYVYGHDGRPVLVAHSAREFVAGQDAIDFARHGDTTPKADHSYCEMCDSWRPSGDGWFHHPLYGVCPACRPAWMRGVERAADRPMVLDADAQEGD